MNLGRANSSDILYSTLDEASADAYWARTVQAVQGLDPLNRNWRYEIGESCFSKAVGPIDEFVGEVINRDVSGKGTRFYEVLNPVDQTVWHRDASELSKVR